MAATYVPVIHPNERIRTIEAIEYTRNRVPKAAAAKIITNTITTAETAVQTMCSVSVSVAPPSASTGRRCIGGQKKPKSAYVINKAPAMRSGRLRAADCTTPQPNASRSVP
jgi:hypothetical protein